MSSSQTLLLDEKQTVTLFLTLKQPNANPKHNVTNRCFISWHILLLAKVILSYSQDHLDFFKLSCSLVHYSQGSRCVQECNLISISVTKCPLALLVNFRPPLLARNTDSKGHKVSSSQTLLLEETQTVTQILT